MTIDYIRAIFVFSGLVMVLWSVLSAIQGAKNEILAELRKGKDAK